MGSLANISIPSIANVQLKTVRAIHEPNGSLIPITSHLDLPFPMVRFFFIYGVEKDVTRGEHAHRECTQALLCPQGTCEVVCDDGKNKKTYFLRKPDELLIVPPKIWMTQTYRSENTILLVATDRVFEEHDYIREHPAFLRYRQELVATP